MPNTMMPTPCTHPRLQTTALLLALVAGLSASPADAATYYWDPDADPTANTVDGTGLGGSGIWNSTNLNWWDGLSADVAWPGSAADLAVFAGASGTVTLSGTIQAGSLQFASDRYALTGGTIVLGGAATIDVAAGSRANVLSDIGGTAGLVKTGAGTLNLGLLNSYAGNTTVNAGVLEVYKDESLGTGGGDIILDGGTLKALGNNFYSDRDITVGAGGATLEVTRNAYNFGSMRLLGQISGAGTLTKTGFGELRLDGDSSGTFTGDFIVNNGIVRLLPAIDRGQVNPLPSLAGASSYTVRSGGDFILQYSSLSSSPQYSMINETAPVHMEGGRIIFYSNNSGAVGNWVQNFGDLYLDRGSSRFYVQRSSSSASATMAFGDLHLAVGTTADFGWNTSYGTLGQEGIGNPHILFNSIPTPVNDGLLGGWALVNQVNFASYDAINGVSVASYTSADITTAGAADNVDMTLDGTTATIGNTTINALKLTATASSSTIEQLDGTTLILDTGGILTLGNYTKYIQPESGGSATLTANGGALYVHNAQSNIYINSIITDGDMPTALVKTQGGSLVLYSVADNTYTGGTYINGAGNVYTGTVSNRAYFGTGPVYVTRGNLLLRRQGATTSTEGYRAFEGASIYLDSSGTVWNTPGDRFTVDGTSAFGGQSSSSGGGGLNSVTYVAGPVSAGGEVHLEPGATVVHGTNSSHMGTGNNTIQNLPNDMQFYFSSAATTTAASGVTIGVGTPWKGLGTDRNTRSWDLGTITVNGSHFELQGALVPNQTGESNSAYTLAIGNTTTAGGPVIVGAAPGPLYAHVTGGITRLDDDSSVFGDTSNGSPLTFLVEPGATLEFGQSNAMGTGSGIASIQVMDGGTLQQYGSTQYSPDRVTASASAINGDVTVQARGRFMAQNQEGLTGTGTLTFEDRSIIQINVSTGWTGSQVLPGNGLITGQNNAIVRIYTDNFGTAAEPTLTTYFDGTGIYEWAANANAANPSASGTPILSLDGGMIISDAFDRNLDATSRGFIELKAGGAGGTIAASTGQAFNINEDVELHGGTLTIGNAGVIDGNPGLGGVRMDKVTSDAPGGMINVISGAQLRISATDAIDDSITVTLQAGGWLDVDSTDTIFQLIGNGATSRLLGDSTLTVTKAGDYDFNVSLGDNAKLTQAGGGTLTVLQSADGAGGFTADSGTIQFAPGVTTGSGAGYVFTANAGGSIDLNGTTQSASSVAGSGTIYLNGGTLEFTNSSTMATPIVGPGIIRNVGTGTLTFNDTTVTPGILTNITSLDIYNGDMRFYGTAGNADSHVINVPVINLGDGLATTGGTGFRVFPRLYLINTEATQTSTLNVNGGWILSDLGTTVTQGAGQLIWSGDINFTGPATINIFDVNDTTSSNRTSPEEHYVSGTIGGTGGFSKVNTGSLLLTANNPISGDVYVQRAGPGTQSVNSQGGLVLTGANGALSALSSLVINRDGSVYLDNSGPVLDQGSDGVGRLGNSTALVLRGNARLRLIGNGSASVNESLGALVQETGSGKINFDLDDSSPQLTTLTFASYSRQAGSITQFQVIDNSPGAFGSLSGGAARLHVLNPAGVQQYGGGTGNGTTTQSIVLGAFGGVNNISNHFMTFDSVNPTELRPLDFNTEYLLSSSLPVKGLLDGDYTVLYGVNQNFMLNYNVTRAGDPDGDVNWYGDRPNRITTNVAMNSLRFGTNTPTSTDNSNNTNEIGSVLVLDADVTLYLGDSLGATNGIGLDTSGSGMLLFGRDISGTNPGSNQYIAGGFLNFGTREALLVNESGNSALIRSEIQGSGGLTKAGAYTIYLDNSNSYTGITTVAEGTLDIRDQNALGGSPLVKVEGSGALYLELGTHVVNSTISATPPDFYVGTLDASRSVLYSNAGNNTWGGNVIIDALDTLGNWVYTARLGANAGDTLNINGNIYGNENANPINSDVNLNDARMFAAIAGNSLGGILNINGQVSDNVNGPVSAPVTSDNENQLLRFQIGGSNEMIVNVRQQWNAAGQIRVENGILRYEGEGNFWTPLAAERMDAANSQSGLRLSGSYGGTNGGTQNVAVILTKPGQVLNISRIDIGGDGSNNYNSNGNVMLAGTNTSGTVVFGDGTDRIVFNGASSTRRFVRDLTVYAAGGGTVELNFRLDDTDGDSHTSFTKIGRGVVNYNGQNDVNGDPQHGDVEQLNMSGGLLRLTNYGNATGRRFDDGAMITLAGGGIEMDASASNQDETANYTGAAVVVDPAFPSAQTLISPGGTDVIVTSRAGRMTTMNIGSSSIALNRVSGGTVNFVENGNGGVSVINLQGTGAPADDQAIAWATYGVSYSYNAAAGTYTLNALDFAMTTAGDITAFAGATRENTDDAAAWTNGNDVSEALGFTGTTSVGAAVNSLHFDADATGTLTVNGAGLEVSGGGIMVSSLVATEASAKTIAGGALSAGANADLIIHQYGAAPLTISSVIADNAGSSAGNALVKTGTGELVLSGINTYTGRTFLNGGTLRISRDANLGVVPGALMADGIHANGGILATDTPFGAVGDINLDNGGNSYEANDVITITNGNGGTATFKVGSVSSSSGAIISLSFLSSTDDWIKSEVGGSFAVTGGSGSSATIDLLSTSFELATNRGITLGGNGMELNVAAGSRLVYGGVITAEANVIVGYAANPAVGRIDKTGEGTLLLRGVNNSYSGLTDILAGTLKWEPLAQAGATVNPFGTNTSFLDGTIVRAGATLAIHPGTVASNSNQSFFLLEWLTFEGGSMLDIAPENTADNPHDFNTYFRGVLQFNSLGHAGTLDGTQTAETLAGATVITSRDTVYFNDDGGYLTGDGGIIKAGSGYLGFRDSSPEWTGQLIVSEGAVDMFSAGTPLGVGTLPIILGHNLAAEAAGEFVTGSSTVQLLFRDEGGYRDVSNLAQDIIVRDDAGLGSQLKRIGARYLAHADVVNYNGTLTLQDDVEFFYQDDARDSTNTSNSSSNTRNDTRSIGAPTNAETVFINFNGSILGSRNISTNVLQGGSGNAANGSLNAPYDDLVINAIFGLNGDNRGWTGDLLITNNSSTNGGDDADRIAIVRLGNVYALNDNLVKFASQGHLQLAGIDKTFTQNFLFVGASGVATTAKIENAAFTDATITFSADATKTGIGFQDIGVGLADGLTFGQTLANQGVLNVVKTGAGETVFGASTGGTDIVDSFSSYTGSTTVEEGTLFAGSNNSFSPYSRFTVGSGAKLSTYWNEAQLGFDVTIGSLSGAGGALVNIENSTLRLGGDNSVGADFAGVIQTLDYLGNTGYGGFLYKIGYGTQRLSGDNTFIAGEYNLAVLEGTLIGGSNTAFGDASNYINLGGVPLVAEIPEDRFVELLLDGTATAVVNPVVMNNYQGNDEGVTVIGTSATTGTYGFGTGGTVSLYQDYSTHVFFRADGASTFRFGDAIEDGGSGSSTSLVKIGSGTVELRAQNSYNSGGAWAAGAAIDGGTVVRNGTLSVFNNGALADTVVELGDTHRDLAAAAYVATTRSLITAVAGGSFDGASNGAGGAGSGAFLNVSTIVDGVTITTADIGKRILVKDEGDNPERNGVYQVVSLDPTGTHMNLVRASDFDETTEMLYGTSIEVTGGTTQAGGQYFMASADITTVNGDETDPVHWLADQADPSVGLVAGLGGLSLATDIDINDTNGTGATVIGGTFTTGTTAFQGAITLQHSTLPGVDNIRELTLTSASNDAGGGVVIAGAITAAQPGDELSISKQGPGTVTITNAATTYTGKTTVAAGTLAMAGDADLSATSWIEVANGAAFDFSASNAGDFIFDGPISGSGTVVTGAGSLIVGTDGGSGVLRPGMSSAPSVIGTAGDGIGILTVSGNLELAGDSSGAARLTLQMGASNGADYNDAAGFSAHLTAGDFSSYLNSQASFFDSQTGGSHDRLVVTGSLTLNSGGIISFTNAGGTAYQPEFGDVFNLLDWAAVSSNGYNVGGTYRSGGLAGDLELPDISLWGLQYNTELFSNYGIVVIVPEPSRALFCLLGLAALACRRRRAC